MEPATIKFLPDDIWSHVFDIGVNKSILDVRDICSLSLSCKNFEKSCKDDKIWSYLLTLDFPRKQRRLCHALRKAFCAQPCFKKNLYKFELKKRLRRMLPPLISEVTEDKEDLALIEEDVEFLHKDIKEGTIPMEDVTGELLNAINNSLDARLMDCREQRDWMILMNKQLKEFSERLLDMIKTRKCSSQDGGLSPGAPRARAVCCSKSTSTSPSSASPNSHLLNHVCTILKLATEKQESILNCLRDRQGKIELLLGRLEDREKHILRITSQMSSLTYPFEDKYPLNEEMDMDMDDTEDENDAEEEDDGGDYYYDDMEVPEFEEDYNDYL